MAGKTKPSRTARGVLAQRAVLTDMGVLADPFAHEMLTPPMAAVTRLVKRWPAPFRSQSVTLAGYAARVLWFDAQVTDALDAGIDQVAVIGAGYDSRAWRFGREGVRFFELDHGATQRDKIMRAPGPGPVYVEADLTTDDAAEALTEKGLDASRPVLIVVEGLTMYLSEQVVGRQLRALATSTAGGSRLAVEFLPPRTTGTSRNRRQRLLQQAVRTGSGETLRCLVDRPRAVELVQAAGWDICEAVGGPDAARAWVSPDSGLPTGEVNEHGAYVSATHS
jgi:methyltransferase (TIGR00027 family)